MTDTFELRPFTRDEYEAAIDIVEQSFFFSGRPEDRAMFADVLEFDRSLGAYAGDRIVGTAGALTFELSVPGGTTPAAGVTIVTVHPAHRRRGVLSALMDRQLTDFHERGEPIAVLRASEATIYGRFGYGTATREVSLNLSRAAAGFAPGVPETGELVLDLHDPTAVRAELAAVYDAVRPHRSGFIGRNDPAWTDVLYDPEHRRGRAGALRAALVRAGESVRGYALYRAAQNMVEHVPEGRVVPELVAVDPAAAAELWRYLVNLDLTASAYTETRPVDEPLLRLLANPRAARSTLVDGLWLRLVRLDEALQARRYAAPVDLVLEVTDARCPWNAGRWRLAGDETGATCARSTDPAELRLDTTALAGGFLGDPVLGGYADAGRIVEERPGALSRLASALGWTPSPWCPHHF